MTFSKTKGLSVIELLIVVSLLSVLGVIVFLSFRSIQNSQALKKTTVGIEALYEEARSNTLASLSDDQYGVYATTTSFTIFKGSTYNESDPTNRVFVLDGGVVLDSINLVGGGQSVLFERLTGRAVNVGTTTIGVLGGTDTIDIVIDRTGSINIKE